MKKKNSYKSTTFSLGPFIKCPHPEVIEAMAFAGFDFAVVDMEHTPLSPRDLYPLKLAAEAHDFDLVVRVPLNQESYLKWSLDQGYRYIQVPFVQTKADAEYAVKMSMFSPNGERGLCRFVRAAEFSNMDKSKYIASTAEMVKLILQIEGEMGVNNLEEIIQVAGLYAIFIGPYDLSQSLGCPGDIWNPKVVEKMNYIVQACKKKNIKLGTFTDTAKGVQYWAEQGIDFIQYGSDLNILLEGSRKLMTDVKG
jgi:4-hydroxy-2-oxoheptanedioate aldolase